MIFYVKRKRERERHRQRERERERKKALSRHANLNKLPKEKV